MMADSIIFTFERHLKSYSSSVNLSGSALLLRWWFSTFLDVQISKTNRKQITVYSCITGIMKISNKIHVIWTGCSIDFSPDWISQSLFRLNARSLVRMSSRFTRGRVIVVLVPDSQNMKANILIQSSSISRIRWVSAVTQILKKKKMLYM